MKNKLLALTAFTALYSTNALAVDDLYPSRVDLTGKLGNERTLGEIDLMSPLSQSPDKITYLDFRGQIDNDQAQEFNLGIGQRRIMTSDFLGDFIIGQYGFLDVRKSENDNMFYQTTLGVEVLSDKLDLRTNAYIPINQEEKINTSNVNVSNSQSGLRVSYSDSEKALYGIDAEVGTTLALKDVLNRESSFRVYAGGYYFNNSDVESVSGPRFRTEFALEDIIPQQRNTKLTLGYEWQHDNSRGTQGFVSLRLSIPFGANKDNNLKGIQKRMLSPVIRDIDIVTNNKYTTENALFEDGRQINSIYQNVDSEQKLQDSTTMGDKNSIVVISDDFSTKYSAIISEGQTIVGGQSYIKIKTPSGKTVMYKTEGKVSPTVESSSNGVAVFSTTESSDSSKVEVYGLKTQSNLGNSTVVIPALTKLIIENSNSTGDSLGNIKVVNLKDEELTYTIKVSDPDNEGMFLTDVLEINPETGEITLGSNAISGGVAPDMIEALVTVTDSNGEEHESYVQVANKEITSLDYKSILPGTYYTNGITINYGSDLANTDVNASGKSKIEYVSELINKLLEKDKNGEGKIIAALEKNQPHLVNFNSLADLETAEGSAYFFAIPNSQDLQADEIFPNANGNNGADLVSTNRDASVEEIVHLIHNYGITYARPDLQAKLNQLTQAALDAGRLDWTDASELPRQDLDDEYLADCVEAFYNLKAGTGYVKTGVGLDPGSNRNDLKAFDSEMHDLISEIFPDSLDLGY